jgi:dipeptidyl aminopeptidase/acylaminoacyl peptidase
VYRTKTIALIASIASLSVASAAAAAADPPANAVISPDGKRAVWASEDAKSAWSATRRSASREWREPERLLAIRGTVGDIVFSPDSRRIAFENPRGAHGFIAVYDIPAGKSPCPPPPSTRVCEDRIRYVDPVFATDSDPVWSGDGRQITFLRHVDGIPDTQLTRPAPRPGWTPPPGRPGDTYRFHDLLAAPISYTPVRSGDGRSLAYITWEATERAINFMRLGGPARRVVQYRGDDGIELSQVDVSRAGGAIAYVRGGAPNSQGEVPNPRSLPDPPQREVWIAGTQGGSSRELLGTGTAPRFSPDDERIVWIDGQRLMTADLVWRNGRLRDVESPEPLFTFTGSVSVLRFSPDGGRLAYQRGSGVEVYDIASGTTWAVPRPSGSDAAPVWSPDGTRLAVRRTPSGQNWGIAVADVATQQASLIWQAPDGVGEDYYALDGNPTFEGQARDQFLWSSGGRIAFAWEGDGFRHLYSVPAAGGAEPTLLTPGEGEVESAEVSLDGERIVYSTNIDDIGRRHLFSAGFDGGPVTAVTSGRESQWAPTPVADDRVAFINAGWASPPLVHVADADRTVTRATLPRVPKSFPAEHLVEPELVEFPGTDGEKAYGQLFVPREPDGCAVIFPHGGPRRAMLPGFHYYDTYSNLYEMNQYLASHGCVVLSVDYRGGIMHGHAFRNAPDRGGSSASEYRDILGGVSFLRARSDVDPERIGIHGLSWGGYIVALALARDSGIFKVGFDMAGTHAAPIAEIAGWQSPVMHVQGDDDRNVSFSQGLNLARALLTQRPEVEYVQRVFPNEVHDLYLTYEDVVDTYVPGAYFVLDRLRSPD